VKLSVGREKDDIGEGAADVDTDAKVPHGVAVPGCR
jgi:hypothetical protein